MGCFTGGRDKLNDTQVVVVGGARILLIIIVITTDTFKMVC